MVQEKHTVRRPKPLATEWSPLLVGRLRQASIVSQFTRSDLRGCDQMPGHLIAELQGSPSYLTCEFLVPIPIRNLLLTFPLEVGWTQKEIRKQWGILPQKVKFEAKDFNLSPGLGIVQSLDRSHEWSL